MKHKHILLFFISLQLVFVSLNAQENTTATDSIPKFTKYGFRLGADLAKPMRSLLEDGYSGFEVMGDFRISKKIYLAAEIGNEKKDRFESNLNSRAAGSYAKLGADYNAYNNWFGLNNAIFTGLRYGFSSFKQELIAYEVYSTNQSFPPFTVVDPVEYSGLSAHWAELIVGVKTEVLTNLYLSINLQLKRMISDTKPENFDNLYVPGFNRTYDFSVYGVGYGYTVSYLIPIYKRKF
ncbi:DUF6048 family protein [Ulvibacter antarcticus]|uniref:Outer membrane protein with beta-barrel domain n=1 Tax=Ulvibacter antarcticus TaxID=442714 RepID=A0A3L9YU21_9FLAO|nr:DUF6048 family protein [Ulvibacter antarcticus]RMA64146.1 hypothetical protein BXY75_1013 [Ulvibacter antarcticus]